MKRVLVTGGAGFIASHLLLSLCKKYPQFTFYNVDKLTYAANPQNLSPIEDLDNYNFIEGNIADFKFINNLFKEEKITDVIHMAAESHVDNSIDSPAEFIETNINGSFCLLEASRNLWLEAPHQLKPDYQNSRFVHVSTDEVYGSLGGIGFFTEESPFAPNSPYSASKASSDLLVRSYFKTYGLPAVTTNCSNNFGPHQHNEKLIPTVIRSAMSGKNIPVYGTGENVRDWIFAPDHCEAVELCWQEGKPGETYNIGGEHELSNIALVNILCEKLNKLYPKEGHDYKSQISFVKDRPGHDWRYAVSIDKIRQELKWQPKTNFDEAIETTIHWYAKKYESTN